MKIKAKLIFVTLTSLLIFSAANLLLWYWAMNHFSGKVLFTSATLTDSLTTLINLFSVLSDHISTPFQFALLSAMATLPVLFYMPWDAIPRALRDRGAKAKASILPSDQELTWAKLFERIDTLEATLLEREDTIERLTGEIERSVLVAIEDKEKSLTSISTIKERATQLSGAMNKIYDYSTKIDEENSQISDLLDFIEVYREEQISFEALIANAKNDLSTNSPISEPITPKIRNDQMTEALILDDIRKTAQTIIRKYPQALVEKFDSETDLEIAALSKRSVKIQKNQDA